MPVPRQDRHRFLAGNDFVVRTISGDKAIIVNVCDAELVGKTVKGDGLEMKISEDYFGGEITDSKGAIELIQKSDVANLVGKRIVDLVVDKELATEEAVRKIGETSFLMIYKFS